MKKTSFVNLLPSTMFAEVFTDANYGGNSQKLLRGDYTEIGVPKSVKLSSLCTVDFYANVDGTGDSLTVEADCDNLKLSFTPAVVVVRGFAQASKDGAQVKKLFEGEYDIDEIKAFDKIKVPRAFYAVFAGNKNDEHIVRIFENEEVAIDDFVDEYAKVALFTLGADDVKINFKLKEELSDDDLAAVAGGKADPCEVFVESCPKLECLNKLQPGPKK